jgi:hypothetical protein
VLGELQDQTASSFDEVVKNRAALPDPLNVAFPAGCGALGKMLGRLDRAIRFARWRHENDVLAREVVLRVLGRTPKDGEASEKVTLTGKLLDLQATVQAAKPVSDALIQSSRLEQHLKAR